MFMDIDVFMLEIFIFRSIVVTAAIFYIYRYTEIPTRHYLTVLLFSLTLMVIFADSYFSRVSRYEHGRMTTNEAFDGQPVLMIPSMKYDKPNIMQPPSTEVMLVTPWLAPIIWTGTFNRDILNKEFQNRNCTIGLSVFALGSYWKLLKKFLESADQFFMVGHKVNYYVYTDQLETVECITTHPDRKCKIYKTSSYDSKERVFMKRMEILHHDIKSKLIDVPYLVCSDVDIVFHSDVGVEILGDRVATLHPGFYRAGRSSFTYERRQISQAYIPEDEGDFYYQANFFAGTAKEIYHLTKSCDEAIKIDDSKGIIATWHDESHFNKYLLYHKPTKILSPEYIWTFTIPQSSEIKTLKGVHGLKNL